MTRALAPTDREHTAARLLASSARHTLDPSLEVDWDARSRAAVCSRSVGASARVMACLSCRG